MFGVQVSSWRAFGPPSPWQAERSCATALGSTPTDRAAASAARALAVWLGSVDISPPGTAEGADCAPREHRAASPAFVAGVRAYSVGGSTA